jgi:hypothetical protein
MFCRHYFYVAETSKGQVSGTVVAPLFAIFPGKAAISLIEKNLSLGYGVSKDLVFVTTLNII